MRNTLLPLVLFCAVASCCAGAHASSSLGGYVGAAAGHATIRADQVSFLSNGILLIPTASYSASNTGWKVFAGIRPISLLAAEIEYVDFGSSAASKAIVGYGVGYALHMSAKAAGRLRSPLCPNSDPVPGCVRQGLCGRAQDKYRWDRELRLCSAVALSNSRWRISARRHGCSIRLWRWSAVQDWPVRDSRRIRTS